MTPLVAKILVECPMANPANHDPSPIPAPPDPDPDSDSIPVPADPPPLSPVVGIVSFEDF